MTTAEIEDFENDFQRRLEIVFNEWEMERERAEALFSAIVRHLDADNNAYPFNLAAIGLEILSTTRDFQATKKCCGLRSVAA